ncbi:initiation factor 2 subunit family domain-containing protein [Phthorimaea operculella]|nr:initiation factor 2 subunit family domain-containing protein [Phthorimaea operculella]
MEILAEANGKPFWYNYVLCGIKGAIEYLDNEIINGVRLVVSGNVPPASGLSSSSALVSAACLSFLYAQNVNITKTDIASLCAKSERYIGTQGGGMDQAIAFLAEKYSAQYITFQPLNATPVALPEEAAFVVAHSLAEANKAATNDFNRRVIECRLAAKILATATGITKDKKVITLSQVQKMIACSLEDMIKLVLQHLPKDIYTKHEVCSLLEVSEKDLEDLYLTENTKHLQEFKLKQRALHVYQEASRVEDFRKICSKSWANAFFLRKLNYKEDSKEFHAKLTPAKKRRLRRKKLQGVQNSSEQSNSSQDSCKLPDLVSITSVPPSRLCSEPQGNKNGPDLVGEGTSKAEEHKNKSHQEVNINMSQETAKSREEIKAAREAKKLAKQKGKSKDNVETDSSKENVQSVLAKDIQKSNAPKCVDEVDRATVKQPSLDKPKEVVKDIVNAPEATDSAKTKEQILAERAAKKAAKQAKKKGADGDLAPNPDMTVKDVVETLKDIKNVAKDVQDLTAKQPDSKPKEVKPKADESKEEGKSKAELKAERRAKQEAQRAAKAAAEKAAAAAKPKPQAAAARTQDVAKEKSPKPKSAVKPKSTSANRVNWFQHLYAEPDKEALKKIAMNSNLHPAVIKLGVQSASRVITGSNARCIALLDALKKMLKDYTLPAKTEFARGFEPHLAASLDFLWAMRQPSASQTNAVKYFRHHLTQLPNNVDEFDAKKILQQEIDHYIEDQIDKAGEAISMTVQKKISTGDNILTYGCSSLIERILREAWQAGLKFRTVVVGDRVHTSAREMLRRLAATGLPCSYVDMTAVSHVMTSINKVLLGAGSLLVNGSVLGLAGTAQVAMVARDNNVPVLVACETHKFSERVQTDAFVYNELGDPDALIDRSDDASPLKDWRNNPNLTPLNLTYDVTPASLVTAVVTEKAILPCTSAPVVLRTKLTEYGM